MRTADKLLDEATTWLVQHPRYACALVCVLILSVHGLEGLPI